MMRPDVSLVVTTYGSETAHTQRCLGRLREWKDERHQVVVVCHDETPLLRAFLELARRLGIVDDLVPAVPGHGHVRGVNLGFARARAELVFNVCVDMRIGPGVVDDCAARLRAEPRLGMIGWHYDWSTTFEGTFWRGDVLEHTLRKHDDSRVPATLDPIHVANMRGAAWHTGRVFGAIGTRRILCCNGSFFGTRKALWDRLGGFDDARYPRHWADDFFTYAVLDQGMDVANLPAAYRCGRTPRSFEALTDLVWPGRSDPDRGRDQLDWRLAAPTAPELAHDEVVLLEVLERCLADDARVAVVGAVPWRPARHVPTAAADVAVDLLLVAAADYVPRHRSRLREGGVLVVFGAVDAPGMQRTSHLSVHRRETARAAFTRTALP